MTERRLMKCSLISRLRRSIQHVVDVDFRRVRLFEQLSTAV